MLRVPCEEAHKWFVQSGKTASHFVNTYASRKMNKCSQIFTRQLSMIRRDEQISVRNYIYNIIWKQNRVSKKSAHFHKWIRSLFEKQKSDSLFRHNIRTYRQRKTSYISSNRLKNRLEKALLSYFWLKIGKYASVIFNGTSLRILFHFYEFEKGFLFTFDGYVPSISSGNKCANPQSKKEVLRSKNSAFSNHRILCVLAHLYCSRAISALHRWELVFKGYQEHILAASEPVTTHFMTVYLHCVGRQTSRCTASRSNIISCR